MSSILDNFTSVDYVVVTTYEDDHNAYSVATTDKSIANDHMARMKRGFFRPSIFGRVKSVIMVERTTTVKKKIMD